MDSNDSFRTGLDPAIRFGAWTWEKLNALVKTPVFVFLVGGSFAAWYPTIHNATTPASEKAAQKAAQDAREDAALIAPLLANLDVKDPGKYQASRAILLELAGDTARGERPVIVAAIHALEGVATQVYQAPTLTASVDTSDKGSERVFEVAARSTPSDSVARPQPRPTAVAAVSAKDSAIPGRVQAPAPSPEDPALARLRTAAIYIQASQSDPDRLALAETLRRQFLDAKILAPAVQRIESSRIPRHTQVRYYHDEDRAMAEELAELASTKAHLRVVLKKPIGLKATPGILELWLGKS